MVRRRRVKADRTTTHFTVPKRRIGERDSLGIRRVQKGDVVIVSRLVVVDDHG